METPEVRYARSGGVSIAYQVAGDGPVSCRRSRRAWTTCAPCSTTSAPRAALLGSFEGGHLTALFADVLPAIRVPTFVCFRDDYRGPSEFVADQIPGARSMHFPGKGYFFSAPDELFEEVQRFLTGLHEEPEPDRVLATILFTDMSASTELAARVGDREWVDLLRRHHGLTRSQLARFRGHEIDTAGDGFLATFEGPARAIRCACAIRDEVRALGIEIRAGLHTGECELVGGKVAGLAVNTGARVAAAASPGEVLVSSTVRDLVAGSGIAFEDRGEHELRGVGPWRLYSVTDA